LFAPPFLTVFLEPFAFVGSPPDLPPPRPIHTLLCWPLFRASSPSFFSNSRPKSHLTSPQPPIIVIPFVLFSNWLFTVWIDPVWDEQVNLRVCVVPTTNMLICGEVAVCLIHFVAVCTQNNFGPNSCCLAPTPFLSSPKGDLQPTTHRFLMGAVTLPCKVSGRPVSRVFS